MGVIDGRRKESEEMQHTLNEELNRKIEVVLKNENTHEAIILKDILNRGFTTVRDLLPKMNCPYSAIRDLQQTFGIALECDFAERKTKTVRNGKEIEVSKRFKIYKLAGV